MKKRIISFVIVAMLYVSSTECLGMDGVYAAEDLKYEEANLEDALNAEEVSLLAVQNLKAITIGNGRVKLSWNSVENAEGYLIYRQIGNTWFEYLDTTTQLDYTDITASQEEYNFYRVYPYCKNGDERIKGPSEQYVYAKGRVGLSAVSNLKVISTGKRSVELSWNSVSGADGYLVYRKIGNTKFEHLNVVNQTNYVDTAASEMEYNFYRIYPFYMKGEERVIGSSEQYVYAKGQLKLNSVANLKATTIGDKKVKLSWSSVENAEGYLIYRQIGNTNFEYCYMVSGTNYIDTTASQEEYNFYRVYPYYKSGERIIVGLSNKYVYAKGSLPIYLTAVKNLEAAGVAKGRVDLTWDAVEGAEGYLVYRQIGNTKFEYRYMVNKTSYSDVTASQEEYNFYRVYPYYMNGKQRVIGPSDTYVYSKGIFPAGWYWIDGSRQYINESGYIVQDVINELKLKPNRILNFPLIYQYPELPTGCEITAMTMVLQYYGCKVSKTTMASQYLPQVPYDSTYYGNDGKKYGPDLYYYFVGNPFGKGTICGSGALVIAANTYLQEEQVALKAVDITGSAPEELYGRVSAGQPVVVLTTIGMFNRCKTSGWYTNLGQYVDWSTNDHGSVLIGWDESTVTIACPIYGIVTYSRKQFEEVYRSRGCQAVVLE